MPIQCSLSRFAIASQVAFQGIMHILLFRRRSFSPGAIDLANTLKMFYLNLVVFWVLFVLVLRDVFVLRVVLVLTFLLLLGVLLLLEILLILGELLGVIFVVTDIRLVNKGQMMYGYPVYILLFFIHRFH
jgi:hypothetical protein